MIAGYRPIYSELNPTCALERLLDQGAQLCLPVVIAKEQALEFHRWKCGEPLKTGAFGVQVPRRGKRCIPEHIVVPLLGWDRTGARLGYGGGYYDRTLRELRMAGSLNLAIGFAFAAQEVPTMPRAPVDELLDAVVTEKETAIFGS